MEVSGLDGEGEGEMGQMVFRFVYLMENDGV